MTYPLHNGSPDEALSLHRTLLARKSTVLPPGTSARTPSSQPDTLPAEPEPPPQTGLQTAHLTEESRDNIDRAPDGTRFYCVSTEEGTVHCAASRGTRNLEPHEQSSLGGQLVDPIAPSFQGTGHQQVARRAGLEFDDATARVGYVDGEGYGLSITKVDACQRDYTWTSAFNRKACPQGSRILPQEMAQTIQAGVEASFPACPCDPSGDPP
ncbi:MAG: hypothetical protein AAFX99_13130 [Myxococcota bacterium]